jgi:HEAT repeat protein
LLTKTQLLHNLQSIDAVTAVEAAKEIHRRRLKIDRTLVRNVASNKRNNEWARAAAIYLLGNLRDSESVSTFSDILRDERDVPRCREYAAEALGYIGDPTTLPLIEQVCAATTSFEIKESCEFALKEIPAAVARLSLSR